MTNQKSKLRLPPTIPVIPNWWTPDQAFAVFEMLDELRDAVWRRYKAQLLSGYCNQLVENGEKDEWDDIL